MAAQAHRGSLRCAQPRLPAVPTALAAARPLAHPASSRRIAALAADLTAFDGPCAAPHTALCTIGVRVWRGACRPAHGPRRSLAFNPLTLEEAMQWEGPAEVPVDLILFRWINFHLGKVLLQHLRLAPSSVRLPQPRGTSLC